jgi:hypothetical protein
VETGLAETGLVETCLSRATIGAGVDVLFVLPPAVPLTGSIVHLVHERAAGSGELTVVASVLTHYRCAVAQT